MSLSSHLLHAFLPAHTSVTLVSLSDPNLLIRWMSASTESWSPAERPQSLLFRYEFNLCLFLVGRTTSCCGVHPRIRPTSLAVARMAALQCSTRPSGSGCFPSLTMYGQAVSVPKHWLQCDESMDRASAPLSSRAGLNMLCSASRQSWQNGGSSTWLQTSSRLARSWYLGADQLRFWSCIRSALHTSGLHDPQVSLHPSALLALHQSWQACPSPYKLSCKGGRPVPACLPLVHGLAALLDLWQISLRPKLQGPALSLQALCACSPASAMACQLFANLCCSRAGRHSGGSAGGCQARGCAVHGAHPRAGSSPGPGSGGRLRAPAAAPSAAPAGPAACRCSGFRVAGFRD